MSLRLLMSQEEKDLRSHIRSGFPKIIPGSLTDFLEDLGNIVFSHIICFLNSSLLTLLVYSHKNKE